MARASPALTNFNGGEFGPTLVGRTDISKYPNGCTSLENFLPLVQGPLQRRPGTRFVAEVKDSGERVWKRRFEFSASQAYILEFGDQYIRFYADHGQLVVSAVTAWSNATAYEVGDLASQGGVNYYCIEAHTNQMPPNATYWYPLTGSIYEIPSPYLLADLTNEEGVFALDIEQSADVLYIAGAGIYPAHTLTRHGNTEWILEEYAPENGPFLDQNIDKEKVIWCSGQTGTVTINANADIFSASDVGRLIRIQTEHFDVPPWEASTPNDITPGMLRRNDGKTYKALNTRRTGTVGPVHTEGIAHDGEETGEGVFWEYQDAGYGIARITSFTAADEVEAEVLVQLPANVVGSAIAITGITQANPGVVSATAHGRVYGDTVYIYGVQGMTEVNNRWFKVDTVSLPNALPIMEDTSGHTAYTSGGFVVANATKRWSLGAWSETTGYPSAVAFAFDRLWWAGGVDIGIDIWSSVPGKYDDLSADIYGQVTADAAITRKLTAQDVNRILWMVEADRLIIGTPGGEFALGPITSVDPLGPENVQIKRQSKKKCRSVRPLAVGTSVVYVQRAGRRLLRMDYAFEKDRFSSTNMNALAPHITKSGIVDMAFAAEPDPIIWCVLANGSLVGFTLDEEQEVTGWHRHPIGGNGFVEAVASIPSPDGDREEVWITVRRTINGQTKRYIEYIEKPWEDGDDQEDVFYVDSGLTYDGAAATTISGLSHLEGQTVQIIADGASHPDKTVSGGQITLDRSASVVQVGLACAAKAVTMRIDAGSEDGTSQGKVKRVHGLTLRLVDTLGGKIGLEDGTLTEIDYRRPSMSMDQPPEIFSGDKEITFNGDYEPDCKIEVRQTQAFPMTIAAIYPRLRTYDARK